MRRAALHANRLISIAVLSLTVLAASRARADEPAAPADAATAIAKLNDEGIALYKARDYRHAVEKFLQAYSLDGDPNLLFNIARCYEGLGDRASAIEKYEAFMAKPDADPQGNRRAAEAIRALRKQASAANETGAAASPAARHVGRARRRNPEPGRGRRRHRARRQ